MMQQPVDIKGKKALGSIELHPDLKPEAVKRLLSELSADATKRARTQKVIVVLATN